MLKKSTLFNVFLSIIVLALVSFVGITGSRPSYDPWLDVNDDGYGGIDDIVSTAEHFGASGDPVKLCNITNWPKSTAVTVFFEEQLLSGSSRYSSEYNADGFRFMHVLIDAIGLTTGESLVMQIHSRIYEASSYIGVVTYSVTLTNTMTQYDVVLYVPSDNFLFYVDAATGTTCFVSLSFYLT